MAYSSRDWTPAEALGTLGGDGALAKGIKAEDGATSSVARALCIFEFIATAGPTTLSELSEQFPFHRSSIWRALDTLRKQGWVRKRLGDNAYLTSARFINMKEECSMMEAANEKVQTLLSFILDRGPYHVEFGVFSAAGEFSILESSHKSIGEDHLHITDDNLPIAAQLFMEPDVLSEHLSAYAKRASTEQVQAIESKDHEALLRAYRPFKVVWDSDRSEVSLPLREITDSDSALRISLKSVTKKNVDALEQLVALLMPVILPKA